jgi:hypothetical protein
MPSYKFRVGDTVMLKPSISRNVPGGVYEVIKQLPHNGREYEYRIKSASEEHQRIAGEGELTQGGSPALPRARIAQSASRARTQSPLGASPNLWLHRDQ